MSPEQIARRFYDLFNARKLDDAERLVETHASFHYIPTRQRLIGRAGYRALAAAWLHAFEDAWLDIQSVRRRERDKSQADPAGTLIEVQFLGRGTHTGDLVLSEEIVIPATGRTAELPFHDRLVIAEGLIVESQLNFDVEELKRRLIG